MYALFFKTMIAEFLIVKTYAMKSSLMEQKKISNANKMKQNIC